MSSNMHIERVCKFCKSKFIAKTTKTQYCSNKCSSRAYKQAARQEKLEIAKVEAGYMGKIKTKVKFTELEGKQLLTIIEASAYLNITHGTLRRWISQIH
ncbi:MAG TPA: hypothetical protein VJ552_09005 [Sediminibacterium sp.]|nr:hypothetical protein [Sediminibacterium sp.]